MNLDFAKLCGKHDAIYEAYYKQIDPKASGAIEAMTAAKFLKKSGLSDVVLSRVWDLSDPNGKGFLDKPGFFVALKLVSLAQAGQVINMSNIYTETPNPPKVGDIPKIMPPRIQTVPVSSSGITSGDWSISVIDRLKYEQLFETLKPINGMLPGNKVKGVLMDSKLPMDTLGKIWDLADQDKDGNLDKHEFIVAMHLVYQTLEKRTVPDVLPPELRKAVSGGGPPQKPAPPAIASNNAAMPRAPSGEGFGDGGFVANFPKDIAPPPAIPPLPVAISTMTRVPPVGASGVPVQPLMSTDPLIPIGAPPSVTANADWVVSPADLKRFEVTFRESDRDKDGLVSGLEVKNVFLQSGVPQNCLAHIWALCDTNQSGKLTLEQFALAIWMVERKQKGIEPPQVLTANMVPPSMRSSVSGVDLQPQEPKPTYSNPELEMISKEIEELAKERRALETEIAQKEADIRIKSGEVRSLQSELDTLSATLKQLENQRGEAQKRLDDLKTQVNKIRDQCQKQEETINEQEGELNAKRSELQKLKDEEAALQKEYDQNNHELQKLTQHLQNTQLQISSVRSMVTQLMETQRQMTDALLMCRAAISNQDADLVSEYQLKIEPDFSEARRTLEKKIEEPKTNDPFDENSTAAQATKTSATNGFASNGFSSDPFAGNSGNTSTGRSGFDDSFTTASGFGDSGFDAFGNSSAFNQPQKDPFGGDAFSASKLSNAVTPEPGKDDFGSDPFAALHAPTGQGQVLSPNAQKSGPPPRPESPSPALPPKKSKVPPPRPAPPRPMQGPPRPAQPSTDAFGSNASSGGGGFADFADFDNKASSIPPPIAFLPQTASAFVSLHNTNNNSSSSSSFDITSTTTTTTTTTTPIAQVQSATSVTTTLASTSASVSSSSPSTSVSTTLTSIANISNNSSATSSSVNDHLTRSITPLQQASSSAVTSLFGSKPSGMGIGVGAGAGIGDSRTSIISGPTDFSDDPFKDYRYEDPFSIKDPFADDDDVDTDPEKVFKDDLSDDDKPKFSSASIAANIINSQTFGGGNKSTTPLSAEFLNQFDAFNLNPSPVPSQQSSTSGGGLTGLGAHSSISSSSKKSSVTPPLAPTGVVGVDASSLFDNFANFDAFGAPKPQPPRNMASLGELETAFKSNSAQEPTTNANDSFFEAFNDNFDNNSNRDVKTFSTNTAKSSANICEAFGGSKTNLDAFDAFGSSKGGDASILEHKSNSAITKSSKVFEDFNDNTFEDDFFKTKDNNANASNFDTELATKEDNFAKFDAFGDSHNFTNDFATALNNSKNLINNEESKSLTSTSKDLLSATSLLKVQNVTTLSKVSNPDVALAVSGAGGENGDKAAVKFAADYSKADTFDLDLQAALKRSMLDK